MAEYRPVNLGPHDAHVVVPLGICLEPRSNIRRIYGCLIITVKATINLVEMPVGYCLPCLYGQIIESDACADAGVYGSPKTLLDLCPAAKFDVRMSMPFLMSTS